MLWRAVRGGGDAILSVRVYAGVHALHIGSERCLKYRRDADAARAGESDDLVSFGAREANREGVQMTTRHGDRLKMTGGKHMNLHPGFAQDAILVTVGQHCETSAFAFLISLLAREHPEPRRGQGRSYSVIQHASNGHRIEVATRHISI